MLANILLTCTLFIPITGIVLIIIWYNNQEDSGSDDDQHRGNGGGGNKSPEDLPPDLLPDGVVLMPRETSPVL